MSDDKPDLTKTEARQGNSRRMNLRVLTIAIIVVAIGFGLAIWYNMAVSPETDTAVEPGETIEDVTPDAGTEEGLDDAPLPVPDEDDVVEPAPEAEVEIETEPAAEPDAEEDTQ